VSAGPLGWVYRYSPFKGATFAVHCAIGDSANDQHGYEIWFAMGTLAAKARVTRQTASESVGALVDAGLMEVLEDHRFDHSGRPTRYRMLMPDGFAPAWGVSALTTPGVSATTTPRRRRGVGSADGGVVPADTNPREPNGETLTRSPTDSPSPPARSEPPGFEEFWTVYPRRTAKAEARHAWKRATGRAGGVVAILAGARRFAEDPNLPEPQFIPHPATWLNQDRWEDDPLPPRGPARPVARIGGPPPLPGGPSAQLPRGTPGVSGRLEL